MRHQTQPRQRFRMREIAQRIIKMLGVSLAFIVFYIDLLAHRSAIKADPPSQRMPCEN